MDPAVDAIVKRFASQVRTAFAFLEKKYGYSREGPILLNFEYPKDARTVMRYLGPSVGIEVEMSLGDIGIGIYELENGQIPKRVSFYGDKGYARAIDLDSLVRTVTQGAVRSPLPELPSDISNAEMIRRVERRSEMLRTGMEEILKTYAERLKQYGSDILNGDTSIFPAVQQHHSEFYNLTGRPKPKKKHKRKG